MTTPLLSLIFRSPPPSSPSLTPVGALGLPIQVDSAAWAIPIDHDLHVLINHGGTTVHLRVSPSHQVEELPPLPLVAAGAASCNQALLITGADADGRALMLSVTADGTVMWRVYFDGPTPTRWPSPGCMAQPVAVLQTMPEILEVILASPQGMVKQRAVAVGGPPLDVAIADETIWAAWGDGTGVHAVRISATGERRFHRTTLAPANVAIGSYAGGVCLAWNQGSSVFLVQAPPDSLTSQTPQRIEMADASGGILAFVSGTNPLLWAQHVVAIEDEPPRWISAIAQPGHNPLLIEGSVFAVARWGDGVVIVGATELRFLKQ